MRPTTSKAFTAPVWLLAINLGMQVLSVAATIIMADGYLQGTDIGWRMFLFPVFWILALIAEIVFYWRIRRQIATRKFAWLHSGLVCLAFCLFPLLSIILLFATRVLTPAQHEMLSEFLIFKRVYFFWPCMILAHYFLCQVVAAHYKLPDRKTTPPQNNDDLLTDFEV